MAVCNDHQQLAPLATNTSAPRCGWSFAQVSRITFQDEYLAILNRAGVKCSPKYVLDWVRWVGRYAASSGCSFAYQWLAPLATNTSPPRRGWSFAQVSRITFQDEYLAILNRAGVKCSPKYVLD